VFWRDKCYRTILCLLYLQPATSDSWRHLFFTLSGILFVATVVFWTFGSGQRQWWAIYVEMPNQIDAAQAPASDAGGRSGSGDVGSVEKDEQQRVTEDDRGATKMSNSAAEAFAAFMRRQQQKESIV